MSAVFEDWELEELNQAHAAAMSSQDAASCVASWWAGYFAGSAVGVAQGRLGVSRLIAQAPGQVARFGEHLEATIPPLHGFTSVGDRAKHEGKKAA